MGFKDNIKHLRKQNGLTQQQLADHLHLSRSAIASYETGRKEPNYNNLIEISSFFNVCCDCLITDTFPIALGYSSLITADSKNLKIEILNLLETFDKRSLMKIYTFMRLLQQNN